MKKIAYYIIAIWAILMPSTIMAQSEPYAVLSDNNTKLIFYYDDQKAANNGMGVGPFDGTYDNDLGTYIVNSSWFDQRENIATVEFDVSFANCNTITSTAWWFYGCKNLKTITNISNLKTDNVTDMSYMFWDCSSLTSLDVSGFKTDKVRQMSFMFGNCSSLMSLDVSGFKTDNVSDLYGLFLGCSGLTSLDVSGFNTNNVTHIGQMFNRCSGLTTLDLSSFNTANVIYMSYMFSGCSKLETIYVGSEWSTANVTDGNDIFKGCTNLVGGMETRYDSNHTDYTYAHIDEGTTNPGYFSSPNTFRLLISATGNGMVTYNMNTIRDQSATYVVEKDASVTITITPDAGNRLKSLSLNGNDDTSNITNGKYTISSINEKTTIDVVFEAITAISVDGIDYSVVSVDEGTVKVASGNYGLCLEVPITVSAYNKDYSVIGIETGAFNNSSELAAIIWNPEVKLTEIANNPNLLLYVKSKDYAPSAVNNVIVGNKAEKIVLTDAAAGNNFYCPQEFTADKITYEHNYSMKTGVNTCQGWETIALPFDVSVVYNDLGTELVPYSLWKLGDNKRPFWLYSLNDNGWGAESAIKADTPYIISMPNNDNYDATYNLSGNIVFSASNVKVQASDNLTSRKYGNRELVPNYQNKENNTEIFALNVNNLWDKYTETDPLEGSTFIRNLRQVRPFEAYMTIQGKNTTRSISIFGDDDVTGIVNLPMINNGKNGNIKVYTLSGVLVKQGTDESVTEGLPKGIYIINNKKVVID